MDALFAVYTNTTIRQFFGKNVGTANLEYHLGTQTWRQKLESLITPKTHHISSLLVTCFSRMLISSLHKCAVVLSPNEHAFVECYKVVQ